VARKTAAQLGKEIEVLRSEMLELDAIEDADEDELTRSDEILAEIKALKPAYDAALAKDKDREVVRSLALNTGTTEGGDGAVVRSRRGPEVLRRADPYDGLDSIRRGGIEPEEMVSRARNAIEAAPEHMTDNGKQRATELVELGNKHAPLIARHILLTGSAKYHEEFQEYVASYGQVTGEVMRTAMSLTAGNGGVMVPMTLDPTIILTNSGIQGPIRSIATTKTIATDDWNGVTSAGVTAEWLGEGVQAADASPTFVQPTITPRKAAAWVFGSYEMLADSGFASELGPLLADAKTRLEEAAFATGNTGASVPRGIVAAVAAVTASLVSSATITSFVVGDVYRVADALRPRDASQASWIANKTIYSKIRQFDTSGSSAFWANLGMGVPSELLGQPQYECSTMGAVITTSANILLAGDFKKYYIVDRVGMSVLYEPMVKSTNAGRPTGQAGWFAFWRVGADVVDVDAFRMLQLHTTPGFTALG
jgi:HK97 family phage major capsid protein